MGLNTHNIYLKVGRHANRYIKDDISKVISIFVPLNRMWWEFLFIAYHTYQEGCYSNGGYGFISDKNLGNCSQNLW